MYVEIPCIQTRVPKLEEVQWLTIYAWVYQSWSSQAIPFDCSMLLAKVFCAHVSKYFLSASITLPENDMNFYNGFLDHM